MHGSVMSSSRASDDSFNSSGSTGTSSDDIRHYSALIKSEGELCFGCGGLITERYLLIVLGHAWHADCLTCSVCQVNLDRQTSCFIRGDNIYCKNDYASEFGTKCAKCSRSIQCTDWVRHAKDKVYHLACFACDSCKRQLSTGEEFALQEDRVLCKAHYIEAIEGGPNSDVESSSHKQKTKRARTTFSEEQVQILQANFNLDSNPDGQDLERIAQLTGLSKRITQVWFQNSRARQKKDQQSHHNKLNNLTSGVSSCITGMTYSVTSPDSTNHRAGSPLMVLEQSSHNMAFNHLNNALSTSLGDSLSPLNISLPNCSSPMTSASPEMMTESSWHTSMTAVSDGSMSYAR